ncbi:MAG: hypothetical protein LBC92_04180 [Rickettsiales bacterium]|jgi:hypothetical protein|nr:hypothetical protein [Rickettsiales bacterium]
MKKINLLLGLMALFIVCSCATGQYYLASDNKLVVVHHSAGWFGGREQVEMIDFSEINQTCKTSKLKKIKFGEKSKCLILPK